MNVTDSFPRTDHPEFLNPVSKNIIDINIPLIVNTDVMVPAKRTLI